MQHNARGLNGARSSYKNAAAPATPPPGSLWSRLALRLQPTDARDAFLSLVVSAGLIAVTALVKYLLVLGLDANAGFVIYVPAVALAAWYRGLLGGILATVLSALVDTVLFFPPLTVAIVDIRSQQLRLIAYLFGGIAVSYLSHRLRTERDRAIFQSAERERALEDAAMTREELSRVVAQERRANELRDAFNSIISHELRTPITAIYGGAKLLASRERKLGDEARSELVDDLEAEADRLYRLVEDLLVLAKSERGKVEQMTEPLLVSRIVSRVVHSEQASWPQARFSVTTRSSIAPARGEETYVEQVLRNLLSNAVKYSPRRPEVDVVVDEETEGIRVRVLDSGAGIELDESTRLFDLFYRSPATSGSVGGAGIGLYVCRVLVEAMGGRVWAAPREEGGSEFGFVLARAEEAA